MPRLRAIGRYENQPLNLAFNRGEEFEADESQADFLLRDAPGSFEYVEQKQLKTPPANKAILEAPQDKRVNDDLTKISGISRAKAMQLLQLGIDSYRALATADPEALMKIQGVGKSTAEAWIEAASEYL